MLWLLHLNTVPRAGASVVSTLFPSGLVPVLLGLKPGDLSLLLEVLLNVLLVLIEVALSLLVGDSFSTVPISTLVDTPLNVMLLGDLQRVGFRLIDLC